METVVTPINTAPSFELTNANLKKINSPHNLIIAWGTKINNQMLWPAGGGEGVRHACPEH